MSFMLKMFDAGIFEPKTVNEVVGAMMIRMKK